jgi:hypothetical protein
MFPDWLNALFPIDREIDGDGEWEQRMGWTPASGIEVDGAAEGQLQRSWLASQVASLTTGHVCHGCNTGWMADLEAEARPLLTPMITGHAQALDQVQQITVATWATKTVIVMESAFPGEDEGRFTPEERRIVMDSRHPPGAVRVFAAAIEAAAIPPMTYWTTHSRIERNGQFLCDLHLHTVQVGTLVLQVVRSTPTPPTFGAWQQRAEPRPGEVSLFPPVAEFSWPPQTSLDPGGFNRYARRGMEVPPDWQLPMTPTPDTP